MDDTEIRSEPDDYFSPPIEKVYDPIAWWWNHKATYPKLLRMAFDCLLTK